MAQAKDYCREFSQKYGNIPVIFGHIQLKDGFIQLVQLFLITPITTILGMATAFNGTRWAVTEAFSQKYGEIAVIFRQIRL